MPRRLLQFAFWLLLITCNNPQFEVQAQSAQCPIRKDSPECREYVQKIADAWAKKAFPNLRTTIHGDVIIFTDQKYATHAMRASIFQKFKVDRSGYCQVGFNKLRFQTDSSTGEEYDLECAKAVLLLVRRTADRAQDGHSLVVKGQVKNVSGQPIDSVRATVSWFSSDGKYINSDEAHLEYDPLLPGQTSPFEVIGRFNPEKANFVIRFKAQDGSEINALEDTLPTMPDETPHSEPDAQQKQNIDQPDTSYFVRYGTVESGTDYSELGCNQWVKSCNILSFPYNRCWMTLETKDAIYVVQRKAGNCSPFTVGSEIHGTKPEGGHIEFAYRCCRSPKKPEGKETIERWDIDSTTSSK